MSWFVYNSQKNVSSTYDKATQAQSEPAKSTTPKPSEVKMTNDYLVVKEWGVRMRLPEALGKVTYSLVNETTIAIHSDLQGSLPANYCGGIRSKDLFKVMRSSTDPRDSGGSISKRIKDYYYSERYPQPQCNATREAGDDILSQLLLNHGAMFDTIAEL